MLKERKLREGKGFIVDETLLASQLLAFCEGMLSRYVRSEFRYRPTQNSTPAGRCWRPSCNKDNAGHARRFYYTPYCSR